MKEQESEIPASVTKLQNNLLPLANLNDMISSLNMEQTRLLHHVIRAMRETKEAFHIFVSGGAGVGKSRLLTIIEQSVKRAYIKQAGNDHEKAPVVVMAPTGTAAFNVKGMTIHSALAIPPNKEFANYQALCCDRINSMRVAWAEVKLIIIDEISMVGNRMLMYIDLRLRQIFNCNKPFGGRYVLVFGDLLQLRPVLDGWVFDRLPDALQHLAGNIWANFTLYELTEVMRQRDAQLIARLQRLRVNQLSKDDIAWVQSRTISRHAAEYNSLLPHIYPTNAAVTTHNTGIICSSYLDVQSQYMP